MDRRMMRDLQLQLGRPAVRLRIGQVTDDSPLSVDLGGSGVSYTSVQKLASYTPVTVGDVVAVLVQDNDLLVLGEIG